MGSVHAVVGSGPVFHQTLGFGIEDFLLIGIEC